MIYFHYFHRKCWHFSRNLRIQLFCFRRAVATLQASRSLDMSSPCAGNSHEIWCWGVGNGSLHFPEVWAFSKKHVHIFSPQKTDPSHGVQQQQTHLQCRICLTGGADGHYSTSSSDLWKSLLGVCWWTPPNLLMNKKHCEMHVAFITALIFLMLFPKEMGFCNLLHNLWKMRWVETGLLSK